MPICLVGDPDQMMYRFAGAKPEILTEQIDEHISDIQTIKLGVNYRSTQEIVEVTSRLIAKNYSGQGGSYPQEFMKNISPCDDADKGSPVEFKLYSNVSDESYNIADKLQSLLADGYMPRDFFIGARTKAQLGYLENSLTELKIPFINIAGGSFWASKHVQDVVSYAKLAYDRRDKHAFARVYNIASANFKQPFNTKSTKKGNYNNHRWLGKQFLAACNEDCLQIWKALTLNGRWKTGIEDLDDLLKKIAYDADGEERSISSMLNAVVNYCYKQYLIDTEGVLEDNESSKLDDLQTVIDTALKFNTPQAFFNYVDEAIEKSKKNKTGNWEKNVIISTVHHLKGLERPIVFGMGFNENETGGLLPHTFSIVNPPQWGIFPGVGKGRIEDERCLAFVLISRAKERVFLSGCREYQRHTKMVESRFVREIGAQNETRMD